jgi:hypothetical protein
LCMLMVFALLLLFLFLFLFPFLHIFPLIALDLPEAIFFLRCCPFVLLLSFRTFLLAPKWSVSESYDLQHPIYSSRRTLLLCDRCDRHSIVCKQCVWARRTVLRSPFECF